jgi:hypothetical protein
MCPQPSFQIYRELTEVVRHIQFTRKNPKVGQKKVIISF